MVEQVAKVLEVQVPGAQGPAWIDGEVSEWDSATAYGKGRGVRYVGNTFRANRAVAVGTAPVVTADGPEDSDDWNLILRAPPGPTFQQQMMFLALGI